MAEPSRPAARQRMEIWSDYTIVYGVIAFGWLAATAFFLSRSSPKHAFKIVSLTSLVFWLAWFIACQAVTVLYT